MRKNKYKVWNPFSKKMSQWNDISIEPMCKILDTDLIPLQFTGLFDKQGKEIYEGDIVKIHDIHPSWKKINHEIVFDDGAFCIKPQGQHRMTSFILFADQMEHYRGHRNIGQFIEVIGNRFENPELLD